ncbi:PhzF family phenazine biosynthesis protein [Cohaesibacter celericrescens]|uniref:PhzF family phenazine biosynthesis protein n=1 Tax=Cohaesibacter celericrescens TaxID=2067669 RepID=UPI0035689026
MDVQKIAAFADGQKGGNPAGVVLTDMLPEARIMQAMAAEVGFSETVFAAPQGEGWRVRYFSPENEVAFCGHATIALGAALAQRFGANLFSLYLNEGEISVQGGVGGDPLAAQLRSLPTYNKPADPELLVKALVLFGLQTNDIDLSIPPAQVHAGADHLVLGLKDRAKLAAMSYDLAEGRALMLAYGLVTIMLVSQKSPTSFDVRNAFASGGVVEDPATGAAAAAFAGYLRDKALLEIDWRVEQTIHLNQGDDMGHPSRLVATVSPDKGTPAQVSGKVRLMQES